MNGLKNGGTNGMKNEGKNGMKIRAHMLPVACALKNSLIRPMFLQNSGEHISSAIHPVLS